MGVSHTQRAYYRRQRVKVSAALKIARFDEQGALARHRPTDYLDTVCLLLEGSSFDDFRDEERYVSQHGATKQRQLADFGGAKA